MNYSLKQSEITETESGNLAVEVTITWEDGVVDQSTYIAKDQVGLIALASSDTFKLIMSRKNESNING